MICQLPFKHRIVDERSDKVISKIKLALSDLVFLKTQQRFIITFFCSFNLFFIFRGRGAYSHIKFLTFSKNPLCVESMAFWLLVWIWGLIWSYNLGLLTRLGQLELQHLRYPWFWQSLENCSPSQIQTVSTFRLGFRPYFFISQ